MEIYYDSIQEGIWFRNLHPALNGSTLYPFPNEANRPHYLGEVLSYDRPDIVLVEDKKPILVIERTKEVPSGHNVGQRFARLAAAARSRVPAVYFGPYAAYKHGQETQGPRYMNLRLFEALANMARIENTAITPINWPVDARYEIIDVPEIRDARIKAYVDLFFSLNQSYGLPDMLSHIMSSSFEQEQEQERRAFIKTVARAQGYDLPPDSVRIAHWQLIGELQSQHPQNLNCSEVVFYTVGMTYIRADPYTGMALLYAYLYCGGMDNRTRNLVLNFPHITQEKWFQAARRERKDIRLYRLAADGILFADGYLPKTSL